MQLKVTPRVEGILQIVGVRWNLSGAVVGFHNFGSNLMKKKNAKGRWRGNRSLNDNLKFVVIKVHGLFGSQPSTKAPPSTKHKKFHFIQVNLEFGITFPYYILFNVQSLPKLEGFIQPLPTTTYAGDVRHLVLELRNQSECAVKVKLQLEILIYFL